MNRVGGPCTWPVYAIRPSTHSHTHCGWGTSTMIEHHREAERRKALARGYDYVIVGAGAAAAGPGAPVGARRHPTLPPPGGGGRGEAPPPPNPPQWVENIGSRYDWSYRYEPSPHVAGRSIPLPLGKVLGGSGSINAMV